jgi:LysM repeat protein
MSRLYNPFMPSLSFASGLFRDNDGGGGDGGGGNDDNKSTTVKSGQTLSQIAEDNNMSVQELAEQNNITNVDQIQAGQTLDLSGANSGSGTYDNGVGLGGVGSNNNDDDDKPNPLASAVASGQAEADSFPSYDAFGNEYATAGEAAAADTTAENQSLIASQYNKQKDVLDSMAGGTYDEVPATITSGADIANLQANNAGASSQGAAFGNGFGSTATSNTSDTGGGSDTGGYDELPNLTENDGSTYDDGAINAMNNNAESGTSNDSQGSANTGTGSLDAAEGSSEQNAIENEGSTYDEDGQNIGSDKGKGVRDDAVDKILVEKYGWTMGADGDALSPAQLASQNAAENDGSTYDDGPIEAEQNKIENDGSTYDDGAIKEEQNKIENDGSTYDDGPIEAEQNKIENDGSTYDEAGLAVDGSKGVRDDAVDQILIEKYGWTMGPDGDAIAPDGSTASGGDTGGDDVTGGDGVTGGGVTGGDGVTGGGVTGGDGVTGGGDTGGGDTGGGVIGGGGDETGGGDKEDEEIFIEEDDTDDELDDGFPVTINGVTYNSQAELDAAFNNDDDGFPVTINGVTYNTQAELDAAFNNAGGGNDAGGGDDSVVDSSGGEADNATFVDTNQDGKITSLEQEIANLRAQLANLTGESTKTTSGMTREEIISAINSAMKNNSSGYDPMSFMNAFGFAMNPSYFGNTIPTYMSENGVYTRRAVKDKDTGETRYVNVPIANGGGQGIGSYRQNRRRGFGSLV